MNKYVNISVVVAILLTAAVLARAQESTEIYIPFGQSPGLSDKYTVMGEIEQVNLDNRTIQMSNASGSYTVKLTEQTSIYLDRSKMQQSNTYGSLRDCQVNDKIEVKWEGNIRGNPAEWIKVQKLP